MSVELYYFSGTGNCLWLARALADRTGGTAVAIAEALAEPRITPDADDVGIVFPAYLAALHGVPLIVERFVDRLDGVGSKRLFAVCTCGGYEIVNAVPAVRHLARYAKARGVDLAAEYTVRLPMNNLDYEHIPVPIETDEAVILGKAEKQVADVARRIGRRQRGKHNFSRRLFTLAMTPMYSMMAKPCMKSLRELAGQPPDSAMTFRELIPLTDRSITVDEGCTGCGTCARVCPVGNIELAKGRPVWLHRCEMCFACDEWCPRHAVHHWGRPNGVKYHHPDVRAHDLYLTARSDAAGAD